MEDHIEPVIKSHGVRLIPLNEDLGEVEEYYEQVKEANGTIHLIPYHLTKIEEVVSPHNPHKIRTPQSQRGDPP